MKEIISCQGFLFVFRSHLSRCLFWILRWHLPQRIYNFRLEWNFKGGTLSPFAFWQDFFLQPVIHLIAAYCVPCFPLSHDLTPSSTGLLKVEPGLQTWRLSKYLGDLWPQSFVHLLKISQLSADGAWLFWLIPKPPAVERDGFLC